MILSKFVHYQPGLGIVIKFICPECGELANLTQFCGDVNSNEYGEEISGVVHSTCKCGEQTWQLGIMIRNPISSTELPVIEE